MAPSSAHRSRRIDGLHAGHQPTPRSNLTEDADLLIAAIALAHDLVLVTNNVGYFARVPELRIEDWLQHDWTLGLREQKMASFFHATRR